MKIRSCENCVHYEHHSNPLGSPDTTTWAPRCTKGLNPALAFATKGNRTDFEPDTMAAFCDHYLWAPVKYVKLHRHVLRQQRAISEGKYSTFGLSEKFAPFFEHGSNTRIRLQKAYQYQTRAPCGYVSISSGWEPVFILMASIKTRCSPYLLDDKSEITGIREQGQTRFRMYRGE